MTMGGADHVLVRGLLDWLLRGRTSIVAPSPVTGQSRLSFSVRYRAVVLVFLVVATAGVATTVYVFPSLPGPGQVLLSLIAGSLWLATAYAAFDAFFVTFECSANGITRQCLGLQAAHLPWQRVARVDYSYFGNWFTFRSLDGPSFRISIYRDGLATLDEHAERALRASPVGKAPHLLYEKSRNPS